MSSLIFRCATESCETSNGHTVNCVDQGRSLLYVRFDNVASMHRQSVTSGNVPDDKVFRSALCGSGIVPDGFFPFFRERCADDGLSQLERWLNDAAPLGIWDCPR